MSQSIDFYIDVTSGQLVAAGSTYLGVVPTLTRNDNYTFRVRLQERDSIGILRDISTSGVAVKLGIGGVDDGPSDGQFKLTLNATTSSAISFNATTTQFFNAISAIAGNATITTYGNDPFSYLITAATQNTALSFGGDSFTLFPTSSVLISTRRFPKTGVAAQQTIQLRRNPAVYADTFTASPTGGVVSLTKIQDGGSAKNESFLLKVGRDAIGGGVVLNYGSNSTTAIPIGANATSFTEALQAVTGIGAGNISVDSALNSSEYTISFVKALGNTNLTTGFTLDASGVVFANFIQSTVTMGTAELDELFAEAGTDSITPTIEIEVAQGGKTTTVYQSTIGVRRDLITTGSVVPADQASYYTKSEADAKFVEDATTGAAGSIDATNRQLKFSNGNQSVNWADGQLYDDGEVEAANWNSRQLKDDSANMVLAWNNGQAYDHISGSGSLLSLQWADARDLIAYDDTRAVDWGNRRLASNNSTTMLNWSGGIGFFGSNPVSKVTTGNVVSGLINYGLVGSGTTYGVLPLSTKTLMTTVTLDYGTIAGQEYNEQNITVTGAAVNDVVHWGLPASVATGIVFDARVTTANTVALKAANTDNQSHTQATALYRILVIGFGS